MARPTIKDKRTKFDLALNSVERKALLNASEKESLSMSEFIRTAAINAAKETNNG